MTSAFESAISEVMAELEKQRHDLVRLHQEMDHVTGSARSRRRQVSATVDARGEITDLTFHGQGYRTMPPNDLSRLIIDTIHEARQAAQSQLWENLADALPKGAEIAELMAGDYDWSESLGDALTLPKPLMDVLNRESPGSLFDNPELNALMSAMEQGAKNLGDTGQPEDPGNRPTGGRHTGGDDNERFSPQSRTE